jgi:hypothetical protein
LVATTEAIEAIETIDLTTDETTTEEEEKDTENETGTVKATCIVVMSGILDLEDLVIMAGMNA